MIINLNIKAKAPVQEETREITRFAWMPKLIGSQVVWLGRYRVLQGYYNTSYPAVLPTADGKGERKLFVVGKWVDLSFSKK